MPDTKQIRTENIHVKILGVGLIQETTP